MADTRVWTVPQACERLGIKKSKFYELFGSGEIPKTKLGGRTVIKDADLEVFINSLPASAA